MHYNANTGSRQPLGRKLKRVADINSMGYTPYEQPGPAAPQSNAFPNVDPAMSNLQHGFPQMDNPQFTSTPIMPQQGQDFNQPFTNVNMNPLAGGVPNLSVLSQPAVQNMALQYGQQLAGAGKTILQNEVEKVVPISKLKYYFAVDTKYVRSKLLLLMFPFTNKDWSVKYERDVPLQPRFEINAPDLYIPFMGYVTYVVLAGLVLGMQTRFSPEQIGILASSALAWCIVELAVYNATLFVIQVKTSLSTLDLIAYEGYKFVGIIFSICVGQMAGSVGYYVCLLYSGLALGFFLVRSLKVQVLNESPQETSYYGSPSAIIGRKRRLYFLLFLASVQPILSWWLSYHLISSPASE